jgi:3-oxoacyl-[acyl-carrier protein] reductase
MSRFAGKRVLVTGRERYRRGDREPLLSENAHVVVLDRSRENLDAAERRIEPSRGDGAELVLEEGDVTSDGDVDRVVNQMVRRFTGVDVLVSSAGIAYEECSWKSRASGGMRRSGST